MKHFISYSLICFFSIALFACSGTKSTSTTANNKKDIDKKMELKDSEVDPTFALESYLKRTPGVVMRGSGANASVQIRGVNSFSGNTQPLFVINGNAIGSSYSAAADILRGMKIKSVEVLKGSDASLYGVRGSGGVIVIKAQ